MADTETPTRLEKLTVCFLQVRWPPAGLNQKVDDSDSLLPHYQPFRRMSMSWAHLSLWTISIKLLTTHSRFEGVSPLWSPLPGKIIKLFLSTSPNTVSLRFNPALFYRDQISATVLQMFLLLLLVNVLIAYHFWMFGSGSSRIRAQLQNRVFQT